MTLDQIRTFQAVVAARSFRRAADVLHITQPAISKQIHALEAELEQRLLERGKSTRLTSAGTALLRHAEHLARILKVAKEEIADIKELRGGHLALGAAHSIATYVLPGLIEKYRGAYPKVGLSIESGWSPEITRRVAAHDLDLGLIVLVAPKIDGFSELVFVPLDTWDLVFVASRSHPLSGKRAVTWDDLKDTSWILNQKGCQFRGYVEEKLKAAGGAMKVEVEVIGFELQKHLTKLGLGVSLLPKRFAEREIKQGSLKVLNVKGARAQGYCCLVLRKDKYIHGAMKAFMALLQESFDPAANALKKYLA